MLTDRDRFKIAVLKKCAEANLSPDETYELIKTAGDELEKQANPLLSGLSTLGGFVRDVGRGAAGLGKGIANVAGPAISTGATSALLMPVGGGALAGHLLARGGEVTDEDVDEEKKRELIDAYREATRHIRQSGRAAKARADKPRAARSLV